MRSHTTSASAVPAAGFCALVFALTTVAVAPKAARAQVTVYTNLASFNAATATNAPISFEGIAGAGAGVTTPNVSPLTVSVSGGSDPNYYVFDGNFAAGSFSLNGSSSLVAGLGQNNLLPTVTIGFGGPFTAFGTEIGFRSNSGSGALVNSFMAQLFNGSTAVGNPYTSVPFFNGFYGFTSTVAFDRIKITSGNTTFEPYQVYDNVRLGAVGPEPGTLSLLGMGLVSGAGKWGITARRRKNAKQAS